MDCELDAASAFLASYLRQGSGTFSAKLAAVLAARYDGHWHSSDPERGSAYRALIRTPASLDASLVVAAADAGISVDELERALAAGDHKVTLGSRWTLWVDPGCVSLRVERGEGGVGRDGQFIEIYGKLPEALRTCAVPLAAVEAAATAAAAAAAASIAAKLLAPPVEAAVPSSPVKRSRAIQIMAPPSGRGALQAMTNAALQPDSPLRTGGPRQGALLASPHIIPPTPVRPLPAAEADVFSPTPAGGLGPPRSPSPGSGSSTSTGSKSHSLSPSTYRPSSPLGLHTARRSSSRASSISSLSADSSDGETSCTDSLFSASGDSSASVASSIHAAQQAMWKGLDAKSRDLVDADGFRIPALPRTHAHSRGSSMSSLAPPQSPSSATLSPSSSSTAGGRSLPGSPTKPRRRGVRGGQSHRSESSHSHHSSISSITSLGSTAVPSTPSQGVSAELAPSPATTPSGRTRTETSSSAQTATEYSNGLVKVLGGGVLLGCAKGSTGARTPGSVGGATGEEGSRRRRRERGRGGRGGGGANAHGLGGDRSGATSPAYGGYPTMPASPVWAPVGVNPYAHMPQAYYGHSPMQA
ncbi:hypothetical protein JCM9279_006748 [Rhodotorula babjevae]